MIADVKYKIIDFKGFIYWTLLEDGSYGVDPLYLEIFKEIMKIE